MMINTLAAEITLDENGFPNRVDRQSLALLQHIHSTVYIWSEWQADRNLYFNGYLVTTPQGSVLIDPPVYDEYLLVSFEVFGPVQGIILTNADHQRCSAEIAQALCVPVWVHEADASLLNRPAEHTFKTGNVLFDYFQVVGVPHQKTAGETVLWCETDATLFVGDAFIAPIQDQLSLLVPQKYTAITEAKASLIEVFTPFQPLVSAIFLGDGEPVLRQAPQVLGQFLSTLV
jgi:glyoxylase-like metal-dependent hydrolase (beta-lactamase superfamily II)